jgi:hypothetical protein
VKTEKSEDEIKFFTLAQQLFLFCPCVVKQAMEEDKADEEIVYDRHPGQVQGQKKGRQEKIKDLFLAAKIFPLQIQQKNGSHVIYKIWHKNTNPPILS